jgi:hypothetical protein
MSREARHDWGEVLGCFSAENAVRCDTWLLRMCKEGTVRDRDKGRHM